MQPNIHCLKKEVIGTHVRADPWSLQPTPSALAEIVVGWRTLLEKCGDALLDDGSKQLPFYFAIWRFDGEMWAQRPGQGGWGFVERGFKEGWGELHLERARVYGAFFRGPSPILEQRAGHSRRQQSVLARTLASLTLFTQSPQQLSQAPPTLTQDTALNSPPTLPCMVQF